MATETEAEAKRRDRVGFLPVTRYRARAAYKPPPTPTPRRSRISPPNSTPPKIPFYSANATETLALRPPPARTPPPHPHPHPGQRRRRKSTARPRALAPPLPAIASTRRLPLLRPPLAFRLRAGLLRRDSGLTRAGFVFFLLGGEGTRRPPIDAIPPVDRFDL